MGINSLAASIAVVDDDPSVRRSLQRLLFALGYRAAVFESAEQFLLASRIGSFDCVLLDIKLRGMDGLELYATLQRLNDTTPVIFISATADATNAVAIETGGQGLFLCKPIDIDQLGDVLASRLPDRRTA